MMEPIIPVNVTGQMISDASMMAINLNGPSLTPSSMTHDEATAAVARLSDENSQLKENLQQANLAMQNAYDMITKLKENDDKKQREIDLRWRQAKEKIETLKHFIADRDKTIGELRNVQASSAGANAGDSQLAAQMRLQLKQKIDQLSQQLAAERTQKAELLFQQETSSKQMAVLKEEISAVRLKEQMLDNLRSHGKNLDKSLKMEIEKNSVLQEQFNQLSQKHEQLLSDYHDLLDETARKADKQSDVTALKRDYDQRLDNLMAQLLASEDVLGTKDNEIHAFQQRVKDYDSLQKQLVQQQEEIEALQAQASLYKLDFEAERRSREELNDERLKLQEKLIGVEEELQAVKRANQIAQVRGFAAVQRSSGLAEVPTGNVVQQQRIVQEQSAAQGATAAPATAVTAGETQPPNRQNTETTVFIDAELKCPMCGHVAPDIDSLQLHCNDCIQ